jgi:DNA primase
MQLNNHHQHWLNKRGVSDEILRLFNISTYEHPQIGECIRIPFTEHHAKYRRDPLDDRKPKYLYDAGGKVTLYGMDQLISHWMVELPAEKPIKDNVSVVITEGELDSLVLWSHNIPAVSSTGGAMSFQEEWATQLQNYEVYLCFDNDDAGAQGMVKVLKYIPDAKVIFIPEQPGVKDISDFVSRGGDFHALMATAKSYPTIEAVEDDKSLRQAQWLPTRFHDAYIEANRPQNRTNKEVGNYTGDDKVLKAKSYPMTNLIEFRQKKACCPWHNEKTPSLAYYPKTNSAYCFGACGRAYDSIDAYRQKYGGSFLDAVKALNDMV